MCWSVRPIGRRSAGQMEESPQPRGCKRSREFGCGECGRRFSLSGHLNRHVRTVHKGEKPFSCDFCGQRFGLTQHLDVHMRTVHEGSKPFACDLCEQRFGRKYALDTHIRCSRRRQALLLRPLRPTFRSKKSSIHTYAHDALAVGVHRVAMISRR